MADGPDRVLEADSLTTWDRDGAVKIRMAQEGLASMAPVSLPTYVKRTVDKAGNRPAMHVKRDGRWLSWTYNEYYSNVRKVARAFIKLGLERHNSVAILGFNAPEWHMSYLGTIFAGGLTCGLYPTNSTEMNQFIMNDSQANILVVEDEAALNKLWAIKDSLTDLKKIVQYTGRPSKPGVLSWQDVLSLGSATGQEGDEDEAALEERIRSLAINQCVSLVYTSGTTGNPKGVMLSHDNIYFTCEVALKTLKWRYYEEVMVSYLPLSHVAAMMIDIWAPLACYSQVYFADKMALKGSLLDTLKEVRPTRLFGVPRVWEKIREGMMEAGRSVTGLKKKVAVACKKAGLDHHLHGRDGMMYSVGQKIFYTKVRQALGLDRCLTFFSGAAPIGIETVKYFLSLDIPLYELYGMSETTGPQSLSYEGHFRMGSVGVTLNGLQSKLHNIVGDEGEMCMTGRNLMMGYLNREDKTTEDIDAEGWIHSGDLAKIDQDGFVFITGRIKELLITAGGENVAPVPIEENIKDELPCISNVILIGDRKKFLTCFLTLKTVIDRNTDQPTAELTPAAQDWCRAQSRHDVTQVGQILSGPDPVLMAAVQAGIDAANRRAASNAARVQKWTVLPADLTVSGGELGPTMKLKRHAFNKKYQRAIDNFYR